MLAHTSQPVVVFRVSLANPVVGCSLRNCGSRPECFPASKTFGSCTAYIHCQKSPPGLPSGSSLASLEVLIGDRATGALPRGWAAWGVGGAEPPHWFLLPFPGPRGPLPPWVRRSWASLASLGLWGPPWFLALPGFLGGTP